MFSLFKRICLPKILNHFVNRMNDYCSFAIFFCCFSFFFFLGIYRTVEAFIRSKYERKQYLKKDGLPPTRSTSSSAKETKSSDKVMGNDRGSSVAV